MHGQKATDTSSHTKFITDFSMGMTYGEQGFTATSWNRAQQNPASRTEPAAAVNSLSNPCPVKWH